ncbi:hypothetical protein C464_06065 [Halorubrum coriense DSM 10284]|uniref:Uncharacterized protein n=1 Tax=Halorubrum coriense DSM 10284 TaxID=1227466 RepID=M0EPE9_9EURY|nr:hypothetical protein [Halorubrum coriense]ELZ48953.1 hypothetical protein C464_06065 [Halorubrum coriense DSM 10284]QRG24157.1 hypothetical protein HrrHm1_230 [Halorubrum virus Humcor1]
MRATILGLAQDDIADPQIESHVENATYPAIDATAYERLDGTTVYAGDAAGRIDVESETIYVSDDSIITETEEATEHTYCEWIADLSEGWLGVNRSDGDWLFDTVGLAKGTRIHRAQIDVDGFAEYLSDYPTADAWNVTQTRSFDADDDAEESVIAYHDAAHLADTGGSRDTVMLGFEYNWNEGYTRGVVSESGYVALFDGGDRPGTYAAFINSEILPFASLPEEYQGTLGDVRDSTESEA